MNPITSNCHGKSLAYFAIRKGNRYDNHVQIHSPECFSWWRRRLYLFRATSWVGSQTRFHREELNAEKNFNYPNLDIWINSNIQTYQHIYIYRYFGRSELMYRITDQTVLRSTSLKPRIHFYRLSNRNSDLNLYCSGSRTSSLSLSFSISLTYPHVHETKFQTLQYKTTLGHSRSWETQIR